MKGKYLQLIINSDTSVDDDQSIESAYKHAMKSLGQSDAEANQLIESYIQSKINEASEWVEGYVSGFHDVDVAASAIVTLLGMASHTFQDQLCSLHYDGEDAAPRIWFDWWLYPINARHLIEFFTSLTDAEISRYKSWIEGRFHSVLDGNLELIREIFE